MTVIASKNPSPQSQPSPDASANPSGNPSKGSEQAERFGEFFPALTKVIPALSIVPVAVRLLGKLPLGGNKTEDAAPLEDPTLQSRLAFNEKWSHFQTIAHDNPGDAEKFITELTASAESLQSSNEPDPEKRLPISRRSENSINV